MRLKIESRLIIMSIYTLFKVFLLVWFWLAFVSIASVYGLIKWVLYFNLRSNKNFLRHYLKTNGVDYYSDGVTQLDPELLRTFTESYCRQDGMLLYVSFASTSD